MDELLGENFDIKVLGTAVSFQQRFNTEELKELKECVATEVTLSPAGKKHFKIEFPKHDVGKHRNVHLYSLDLSKKTASVAWDPHGEIQLLRSFWEDEGVTSLEIERLIGLISTFFYQKRKDYFNSQMGPTFKKMVHPITPCFRAMDRIQLCEKLGDKEFADKLYWDYEGPVIYLLLTCWDILGAKANWMPFSEWLQTTKGEYVEYRDESVVNSTKNRIAIALNYIGSLVGRRKSTDKLMDLSDVVRLSQEYNWMFGVNKSFQFFFETVLTWRERFLLFGMTDQEREMVDPQISSIITKIRPGAFKICQWEMKENGKKIWISNQKTLVKKLQKIRNSFTHSGDSLRGFGPNHQMSLAQNKSMAENLEVNFEKFLKDLARQLKSPDELLVHNYLGTLQGQRIWKEKKVKWCEQVYHCKLVPTLSHIAKTGIARRIELVSAGKIS